MYYSAPRRRPDPCLSSARPAGGSGATFKGLAHERRGSGRRPSGLVAASPAIRRQVPRRYNLYPLRNLPCLARPGATSAGPNNTWSGS